MKDKNFIILCDFDDTMTDLLSAWVNWLNLEYGYSIHPSEVTDWDLTKTYVGLSQEDICKPFKLSDFWKTIEEKPEAAYYIKKLIDEGFDFNIVTATDYRIAKDKFDNCLFRLFPFIDRHKITTSYIKPLIKGHVIIDDYLKNLEGSPCIKILVDSPHNQNSNSVEDFRVYSWKEIYKLIHELYESVEV